ncbi:sigma-70 family RNA polymerase sigma factor [Curtobacterium flaccumfaciens pv. flaccumfaciens]|jgi:RNA polymerase sigma-70 factor (ECF subfamily)|uniref:sigma-70 family RNA polymerase sigma factor n=1 Tax=Curtobacterium flaccumfaciens TaxID=2035 RepID=UPI00217DDFCE|nr:sigma-70 family RNA polymerase sigma factor [Curtobacterium flaccumfaciens]MCS6549358.1 sigma-70 family RNA polymerase sigma factor [Curtobacterium flaccumfaciens pv. flaccumfaciens]MCS6568575.1 sigma-70 family RNA polymerase sigma factor [Curtobacterium flaccumfaciens pv. flaccumfaciens]MCS6586769.1 sigma-70 family RNA polymerase sigma factor [Curtobacterium flaccumfaciens pv. flaccumfaciens]QYI97013.1 sigma-70 family RNA polymerase sigma factor [Curtobacterium flaccumfaciens pv. flaccumfac
MCRTHSADQTEPAAFIAAYQQHAPGLRRFVGTVIVDRHLAEDVVHEAFLEFWQHPDRYDPDRADLQSWLRTVAHRRAIDRIRSLEALRKRELRIGTRDHHSVDHNDDQRDALFLRPTLRIALADLSDKQRDAVVLRYFGERSTAEVASQLGITVGTAKTRVRDGLSALRAHRLIAATRAA